MLCIAVGEFLTTIAFQNVPSNAGVKTVGTGATAEKETATRWTARVLVNLATLEETAKKVRKLSV